MSENSINVGMKTWWMGTSQSQVGFLIKYHIDSPSDLVKNNLDPLTTILTDFNKTIKSSQT